MSITDPVHHFNLAGVDLNLLVVFDALMSEHHVTRAAEKIGLSQPATSNALARLRTLFKDELFVKTSRGVVPTPKAVALVEPIRQALLHVQSALVTEQAFDPKTSDRVFQLGMDDYTESVFLARLKQKLEEVAPNVRIQVRSTDWQRSPKLLDTDEIDVAIGYCPQWQSWHQQQLLYEEGFVCVASRSNPISQDAISLQDYVAASHLLVSPKEDMVGMVDEILAQQNLKRHIALSLPHFLAAAFVIANTHLIATLPERLARLCAEALDLHICPLPFEMVGFSVDLLWHIKNNNDLGHVWLRTILVELCIDCEH
jgi:DNA-binding transcriptional LysR family regulator